MHITVKRFMISQKLSDLSYLAKVACDAMRVKYLLDIAQLQYELKQLNNNDNNK